MMALPKKHYNGTTRPQKKSATKQHLEKRSGERNVDSRFQVQLEEDGGSRTGQSWMETSCLWPLLILHCYPFSFSGLMGWC